MPRLPRWPWSWLAVAALLVGGGCSGDGDDGPPAPSCTRWTPGGAAGPGDAAGHFPLAPGNRWSFRFADAWESLEVTGTRAVLGWNAAVLAGFDLDTRAPLGELYRAVDDHGVVELGNDDAGDAITPLLVPYYVARFPLAVGDAFTSVECTNLDYGDDLDLDGQNERMDVRVVVTVVSVEPVTTSLATFQDAARIEQRITLTVRATSFPDQVSLEALATDWFAPGVGLVREVVEIPGTMEPGLDLVGYDVGGVAKGLLARRELAASLRGPYASAPQNAGFLVAGTRLGAVAGSVAVTAVEVTPGGSVGAPLDLITLPSGGGPLELSPPALAARGGAVAAVAATWNGVVGEVRLQRVTSGGALLEPPEGKVLATGIPSFFPYGCGPAIASDGAGYLGVWIAEGGIAAVRIGGGGEVGAETIIGAPSPEVPLCPVVAFDGTGYLVVYQTREPDVGDRLRAVHVSTGGVVEEETPLLLSATPGMKRPVAMVFDGTEHVLLLADGRDGASTALTLRRLSAAGGWLDGDAAAGGLVLLPLWGSMNQASLYGESLTLDGATPVVAWATGVDTIPPVPSEDAWVMRLGPDGTPLDLHEGRPGVDVYLGGPGACGGVAFPLALGGADGIPEVLYSSEWNLYRCPYPEFQQSVRSVTFGL